MIVFNVKLCSPLNPRRAERHYNYVRRKGSSTGFH